jgi:hypothetical protein
MTCHEIEALRLGLLNVLGVDDASARDHAEKELAGHMGGPIEGLATAESLAELRRHLDAALVDLEAEVAAADPDDPGSDYLRGRLLAVRDAERSLARLCDHGDSFLDDLGEAHHALHDVFPGGE